MFLTPQFKASFGAYFDVDILNIEDPSHVRAQARHCALALQVEEGVDLPSLAEELKQFLKTWDRKTMFTLIEWTNFGLETEEMEVHLRHIIGELIEQLHELASRYPKSTAAERP